MKTLNRFLLAPLAATLLLATACDNPVGSDDHAHAAGAVILQNGTEVARYTQQGNSVDGSVRVEAGAQTTINIQLLDEDGSRFELDGIEYSTNDPTVILTALAEARQIDTDSIRITGKVAGTTSIGILIYHGSHLEFEMVIPLIVE